jgi:lysyl-tRNA synthetase class 2
MTIVSPFDNAEESDGAGTATYTPLGSEDEPLDLTWENVDLVLEEMRPYLLQDGGNVAISEIDGPIVRLELQVSLFTLVPCII